MSAEARDKGDQVELWPSPSPLLLCLFAKLKRPCVSSAASTVPEVRGLHVSTACQTRARSQVAPRPMCYVKHR